MLRKRWKEEDGIWVSMESGLEGRNNVVDNRTPLPYTGIVSMESGLEGRNNRALMYWLVSGGILSQWSPA